jgi:hypothetical protein
MTVTTPQSGRTDDWIKVKNPAAPAARGGGRLGQETMAMTMDGKAE